MKILTNLARPDTYFLVYKEDENHYYTYKKHGLSFEPEEFIVPKSFKLYENVQPKIYGAVGEEFYDCLDNYEAELRNKLEEISNLKIRLTFCLDNYMDSSNIQIEEINT